MCEKTLQIQAEIKDFIEKQKLLLVGMGNERKELKH